MTSRATCSRAIFSACALVLCLLVLAGCAGPAQRSLDAFAPMPAGSPPGASPAAQALAKGLGRGVNFGNMLEAPREGDWGLIVTPTLVEATVAAGFNTVRLPVRWSNHALAERPFTLDEVFARRVESVVDALLAKGLHVVLNMHHYRQLDGDAADPGDMALDPALADERFLTLWQQLARRFRGRGDRLLFELYNEPHGRLDAARWNDLLARAMTVVRLHDPNRVVVVGPVDWNNARALAALRLPNDPHMIVGIHHYEPFSFTHQGAPWVKPLMPTGVSCCDALQRSAITTPLDLAVNWSKANRYPVYLGEFGAFNAADMASRVDFTRTMREQAEARGLSWAYWELASHFGVYDPATRTWREPLLRALMGGPTAQPGQPAQPARSGAP